MERLRMLTNFVVAAFIASEAALVGLGGGLGSMARYLIGRWIHEGSGHPLFPWGTFVVNVCGCFLLGVLAGAFLERGSHRLGSWLNFLGTGFCGGFTTFSALQWETLRLIHDGRWMIATINMGVSVLAGLIGIVVGYLIGRSWALFG